MVSAKIIADSITNDGVRIVTYELEYPRMIHAEFMTHRVFSRNAASSRAIPVKSVLELVNENPAEPVHWGKNESGMQARTSLEGFELETVKFLWKAAAKAAVTYASLMERFKAHKQVVNRILEPFQHIKVVMTTTEDANFFYLRNHSDADPTIKALAEAMLEARDHSIPNILNDGEWHVPYFNEGFWQPGMDVSLEEAIAVSASCCAQVSYRKLDKTIEKAQDIYQRLVGMKPVHASPFEHQATPMKVTRLFESAGSIGPDVWEVGVTHLDRNCCLWSGNLRGWIQNRQLIPNNVHYN